MNRWALDAAFREHIAKKLRALHDRMGATTVSVTHEQLVAMAIATHVGVLDVGRLVQFGTPPDIYEHSVSLYVATRLGQPGITVLPAEVFGGGPRGATQIGLRWEHVTWVRAHGQRCGG